MCVSGGDACSVSVASAYGTQRVPELRMPVDSPYVGLGGTQSKRKIRLPRLRPSEGQLTALSNHAFLLNQNLLGLTKKE